MFFGVIILSDQPLRQQHLSNVKLSLKFINRAHRFEFPDLLKLLGKSLIHFR